MRELLSSARIKEDHTDRGYRANGQDTVFHEGRAGILVSNLPNYNITHFDIDAILMIADEYRRCEKIMKKYEGRVSCDLSLDYVGGTQIYLFGDNIRKESDLEIMAKIRDELRRKSPAKKSKKK